MTGSDRGRGHPGEALSEGPVGVLMVVPMTSARRGLPSHIGIDDPDSGLNQVGYAKCEDLKSMSEHRLAHRIGSIDPAATAAIVRVLRFLLDL